MMKWIDKAIWIIILETIFTYTAVKDIEELSHIVCLKPNLSKNITFSCIFKPLLCCLSLISGLKFPIQVTFWTTEKKYTKKSLKCMSLVSIFTTLLSFLWNRGLDEFIRLANFCSRKFTNRRWEPRKSIYK